jgi:hypothetical protein
MLTASSIVAIDTVVCIFVIWFFIMQMMIVEHDIIIIRHQDMSDPFLT